ncbi:dTDP-glucose 4,6-dehydratase [bacterium]|nr:dTDP-glucose 4,6-dehydratase [bacterium]MBU1983014.1 dTDP-glucose 4,6-dehydratase [bacterium]
MNRLLITGGAGFIGSNFVHYMLRRYPQLEIVNLDALTYAGNLANLADIEKDPRYTFVKGNICNLDDVRKAMAGCDAVVNFAAETHVDRSIHEGGVFVETDVRGVFVLCEEARRQKVKRFLHISTDEVYGSRLTGFFRETARLNPSSPYSSAKAGGELLARSYYVTYKLPVLVTRSSNNYGPFQYPEKLIPLFITNLIENKPVPVYGDGKQVRDWLYVEDQCDALDLVLQKGRVGHVYNVGSHQEKFNIDVTRALLKLLDKSEDLISYVTDRPGHDRRYAVDTAKIERLGWRPRHDFETGLKKTVSWYVQNEDWWRAIKQKQTDYQAWIEKHYGK